MICRLLDQWYLTLRLFLGRYWIIYVYLDWRHRGCLHGSAGLRRLKYVCWRLDLIDRRGFMYLRSCNCLLNQLIDTFAKGAVSFHCLLGGSLLHFVA